MPLVKTQAWVAVYMWMNIGQPVDSYPHHTLYLHATLWENSYVS